METPVINLKTRIVAVANVITMTATQTIKSMVVSPEIIVNVTVSRMTGDEAVEDDQVQILRMTEEIMEGDRVQMLRMTDGETMEGVRVLNREITVKNVADMIAVIGLIAEDINHSLFFDISVILNNFFCRKLFFQWTNKLK